MLATGFETSSYLSGLDVIGVGGESLHDRWGLDPRAYLGVAVSGFPNFFMLYGPNTNQGANSIIYILEAGARHGGERGEPGSRDAAAISTCVRRSSIGSTSRFPPSSSGPSGRDATAITGRRRGASSPSGRTRNSTTPGRHGDYGRGTGFTRHRG